MAKTDSLLRVAAPATCALAAGFLWSPFDAFQLSGEIAGMWRMWAMAAAAACLVAVVVVPAAMAVQWVLYRPSYGGRLIKTIRENPSSAAALWFVTMLSCLLIAVGTYIAQSLAHQSFGSDRVQVLALTGVVPAIVVFVVLVAFFLQAKIAVQLQRLQAPRALLAISVALPIALILGAGVSLPLIAPSVWEQLTPTSYLAAPLVALGALLGVALGKFRRVVWVTGALGLMTIILASIHLATPVPDELRRTLQVEPSGTQMIFSMVPERLKQGSERATSSRTLTAGGASCFANIEPLAADVVGRVDSEAPDIIFITADALRWDHTTLSGYEHPTTPHLAEHAEYAAVFEQAYSPASNTRQSFRGFFTGIYPSLVESPPSTPWGTSFADDQETMASYLSAAGYQTIALSSRDRAFPAQHGALNGFEVIDESSIPLEKDTGYSVPFKVDRIISHLSEPGEERPRFVWTHLMEIHQPYPAGPDPQAFNSGRYSRYDSAVQFVDGELKRLLDFARGPTRINNTIVVITADHGQAFQEHDNRLHGSTLYQEEVHVPLLIWGPGVEPRRLDGPVSGIDILPTLLDLLDLEVPGALCGVSLRDALLEGTEVPDSPVYLENIPDATRDYFGVAFFEGSEKLLLFPSAGVAELYDLRADPLERQDLAQEDPQRLQQRLDGLRSFYEK